MSVEFVEDLKRQWMAMIDAINDPLVIIDKNFTVLRQNRSYIESAHNVTQRSIYDLKGSKCYEVFANRSLPCEHCKVQLAFAKKSSQSWSTDTLLPQKTLDIRVHLLPLSEGETEAQRAVVHYRNISDRIELQEQLAQTDKLAALGKLAGGVAHEINSPLAGILAFAQMAIREMEDSDPHKQDMLEIEEAARKCKVIVENMLGFARQSKPTEMMEIDLYATLESTLRLASPLLKQSNISLEVNLAQDAHLVPVIYGNPGRIGQIFLNLITNAIYAMKASGGKLTIESDLKNEGIYITVRDTGVGIDPAIVGRIFDPFFTTKPIGDGTGLGLSLSYSIVKQHGGSISVNSSPSEGAKFSLFFPFIHTSS